MLPESNINLETIHQQVEKLTNGRWSSVVRKLKSKEELKKVILRNKNEKGEYVFYKKIGVNTEILKLKTEEEVDVAVDNYLSELEENKYQYTKDVVKTCNTLIESRKQNKESNVKVFGNISDKV